MYPQKNGLHIFLGMSQLGSFWVAPKMSKLLRPQLSSTSSTIQDGSDIELNWRMHINPDRILSLDTEAISTKIWFENVLWNVRNREISETTIFCSNKPYIPIQIISFHIISFNIFNVMVDFAWIFSMRTSKLGSSSHFFGSCWALASRQSTASRLPGVLQTSEMLRRVDPLMVGQNWIVSLSRNIHSCYNVLVVLLYNYCTYILSNYNNNNYIHPKLDVVLCSNDTVKLGWTSHLGTWWYNSGYDIWISRHFGSICNPIKDIRYHLWSQQSFHRNHVLVRDDATCLGP